MPTRVTESAATWTTFKGIHLVSLLMSYYVVSLVVTFKALRKDREVVDEKTGLFKKELNRIYSDL